MNIFSPSSTPFWQKYKMNFICNLVHCLLELSLDKEYNPELWQKEVGTRWIQTATEMSLLGLYINLHLQCMHACIGLSVNVVRFCCIGSSLRSVLSPFMYSIPMGLPTWTIHDMRRAQRREMMFHHAVAGSRQGRQRSRYSRLCVGGRIVSDSEEMPAA